MGASPLHTCTNRKLNDRQTGARLQPVAVLCVTPTTTQLWPPLLEQVERMFELGYDSLPNHWAKDCYWNTGIGTWQKRLEYFDDLN